MRVEPQDGLGEQLSSQPLALGLGQQVQLVEFGAVDGVVSAGGAGRGITDGALFAFGDQVVDPGDGQGALDGKGDLVRLQAVQVFRRQDSLVGGAPALHVDAADGPGIAPFSRSYDGIENHIYVKWVTLRALSTSLACPAGVFPVADRIFAQGAAPGREGINAFSVLYAIA